MVPWQCETSTKQCGQKKHFKTQSTLSVSKNKNIQYLFCVCMLELKHLFFRVCYVPCQTPCIPALGPISKNFKSQSLKEELQKYVTCKNGATKCMHVGRICKHRVSVFIALSHPASTSQTTGRWRKFCRRNCRRNCDPRSPAPTVD